MRTPSKKACYLLFGVYFFRPKNKQSGFILVMFLLLVLMIGLFAMTLHDQLQLTLRTQKNYVSGLQQFYVVEAVLSHAEVFLGNHRVVEHQLYSEVYAGYRVFYYFQRLQTPFCFQQQRAYYYRITAYLTPSHERPVSAITLQTTYACVIPESCQENDLTLGQLGRSAWREQNH